MIIYIYRLYSIDESIHECYIGSTNNIYNRLKSHKTMCYNIKRREYNYKVYRFIRTHGGWDNWLMEVIGEKECETRRDKEQIEQEYIDKLEPELNSQKSCTGLTIKEYKKQYRIANKEKISQCKKQWYVKNKEKNKQRGKEYYLKNKDEINRKQREYRAKK